MSGVFAVLIALLVFPFPFSLRNKIISFFSRFLFPTYVLMSLLTVVFVQEFLDQRKYSKRRIEAVSATSNSMVYYYTTECFKHQRNMYIVLLTFALASVFTILIRVLKNFLNEHKLLQEQLSVHQNCPVREQNRENAPQ